MILRRRSRFDALKRLFARLSLSFEPGAGPRTRSSVHLINVGIVGVGSMGRNHALLFAQIGTLTSTLPVRCEECYATECGRPEKGSKAEVVAQDCRRGIGRVQRHPQKKRGDEDAQNVQSQHRPEAVAENRVALPRWPWDEQIQQNPSRKPLASFPPYADKAAQAGIVSSGGIRSMTRPRERLAFSGPRAR